jgi:hypothetical protein
MRIKPGTPMSGRVFIQMTTGKDPGRHTDPQLLQQGIETGWWDEHGVPAPWPETITVTEYDQIFTRHDHTPKDEIHEDNPDSEPPF